MSRIATVFAERQSAGKAALLLYVTAGHPTLDASRKAAIATASVADIVEIGIPFSDPVADGPVVQESTQVALRNGTTIEDCFELARAARDRTEAALVFLTYYNPILRFGLDRFAARCAEAGVDGVICADLPAEEAPPLHDALAACQIDLIPMLAPTSTDERLDAACKLGSGFVYCVSRTGVTGMRESLSEGLAPFLERVRSHTNLPRAVGFGVSNAAHARQIASEAEGVIIGSAFVRLIEEAPPNELEDRIHRFAHEIRDGMDG